MGMLDVPEPSGGSYEGLVARLSGERVGKVPLAQRRIPKLRKRNTSIPMMDIGDESLVEVTIWLPKEYVMGMEGESYEQAVHDYLLARKKTWWVSSWFTRLKVEKEMLEKTND